MNRNYPTLDALWREGSAEIMRMPKAKLDFESGYTLGAFDGHLKAESLQYDIDLGRELWCTPGRWTKLISDYLPPWAAVEDFAAVSATNLAKHKTRGAVSQLLTRLHAPDDRIGAYRMGNCMTSWTFRTGGRHGRPTLGLHSRTSMIAWVGGLDLGMSFKIGEVVAEAAGIDVAEMGFVWYADSLQWHGFKSVPFAVSQGHVPEILNEPDTPGKHHCRRVIVQLEKWWRDKRPLDREHTKYGPMRRLRKNYENVREGNPRPSVMLSDLSIRPEDQSRSMQRRLAAQEEED